MSTYDRTTAADFYIGSEREPVRQGAYIRGSNGDKSNMVCSSCIVPVSTKGDYTLSMLIFKTTCEIVLQA
jgi:hypothetical protein